MSFSWLRRSFVRLWSAPRCRSTVRAWFLIRAEIAYMSKVLPHPRLQFVNFTNKNRLNWIRSEVLLIMLGRVASNSFFSRSWQSFDGVDFSLVRCETFLRKIWYWTWHLHCALSRLTQTRNFKASEVFLTFVNRMNFLNLLNLALWSLRTILCINTGHTVPLVFGSLWSHLL